MEAESPVLTIRQGGYMDAWHRFVGGPQRGKGGLYLHTKCGRDIYDHWNIATRYNIRLHNPCGRCWPGGKEELDAKLIDDEHERPADAGSKKATREAQPGNTGSSEPLTSTPEPLVPPAPDAGDGDPTPEQGSGVQRAGHTGHVDELSKVGEIGDSTMEGGTQPEGGQGKSVREPDKRSSERPAGGRKPQGHTN